MKEKIFVLLNNYIYEQDNQKAKIKLVKNEDNYTFVFNNENFTLKEDDLKNLIKNRFFLLFFKMELKGSTLEVTKRDTRVFKKEVMKRIINSAVTHTPKLTDAGNSNFSIPLDLETSRTYHFLDSASYFDNYLDKIDWSVNSAWIFVVEFIFYLLKNEDFDKAIYNLLNPEQKELVNFIAEEINKIFDKRLVEYKNRYKTIFVPYKDEVINISILNNTHFLVEISQKIKENIDDIYSKTTIKWAGLDSLKRRNISNLRDLGKLNYIFKFEIKPFKENKNPLIFYLESLDYENAVEKITKSILNKIKKEIKESLENFYYLLNLYVTEGYNLYYNNAKTAMKKIIKKFLQELVSSFKEEEIDLDFLKDMKEDIKNILYSINLKEFYKLDISYQNENLLILNRSDFVEIFDEIFERVVKWKS